MELLERIKRASPAHRGHRADGLRVARERAAGDAPRRRRLPAQARVGARDHVRREAHLAAPPADRRERGRCAAASRRSRPRAPLASCLESGDVLPLALDIVLRADRPRRARWRAWSTCRRTPGEGLELRGFADRARPGAARADRGAASSSTRATSSAPAVSRLEELSPRARAARARRCGSCWRCRCASRAASRAGSGSSPTAAPFARDDRAARGARGRAGGAGADQLRALPAGAREGVRRRRHRRSTTRATCSRRSTAR